MDAETRQQLLQYLKSVEQQIVDATDLMNQAKERLNRMHMPRPDDQNAWKTFKQRVSRNKWFYENRSALQTVNKNISTSIERIHFILDLIERNAKFVPASVITDQDGRSFWQTHFGDVRERRATPRDRAAHRAAHANHAPLHDGAAAAGRAGQPGRLDAILPSPPAALLRAPASQHWSPERRPAAGHRYRRRASYDRARHRRGQRILMARRRSCPVEPACPDISNDRSITPFEFNQFLQWFAPLDGSVERVR